MGREREREMHAYPNAIDVCCRREPCIFVRRRRSTHLHSSSSEGEQGTISFEHWSWRHRWRFFILAAIRSALLPRLSVRRCQRRTFSSVVYGTDLTDCMCRLPVSWRGQMGLCRLCRTFQVHADFKRHISLIFSALFLEYSSVSDPTGASDSSRLSGWLEDSSRLSGWLEAF